MTRSLSHFLPRPAPLALAISLLLGGASAAWAQSPANMAPAAAPVDISIPAQPLGDALNAWARQTGTQIAVQQSLVVGKSAPAVSGRLTARQALDRLLVGSGLVAVADGSAFSIRLAPPIEAAEPVLPAVTVRAGADALPGELPIPFAGGQLARGGRIGVLGNTDFTETPFSTTAFTDEFKDNLQARTISDIVRFSPSIQVAGGTASAGSDTIYLRGFRASYPQNTIDGLGSALGLLGRMPPVEPYERFEVLLGASAFANGQPGTVGGTINLVSKRAGDTPLARVGVRFESDSVLGTTVDVARRFGSENQWGLRMNAAYSDGDTTVADTSERKGLGALALDYRSDRVRASLDLLRLDTKRVGVNGTLIIPLNGVAVPPAPDARKNYAPKGTLVEYENDYAIGRVEWDFADRWTASFAHGVGKRKERFINGAPFLTDAAGTLEYLFVAASPLDSDDATSEVKVRGAFRTGPVTHELTLGATRVTVNTRSIFGTPISIAPGSLQQPNNDPLPPLPFQPLPSFDTSNGTTRGLHLSDQLGFFDDRLKLILGARKVNLKFNEYDSQTGAPFPGYSSSAVTPAYGILFKLIPGWSIYANRVEALDNGVTVSPPASNAGDVLPPVKSKQTEVGLKADFGAYALTAALYQIDQANQYLNAATNVFVQNGLQRNQGLELSLFGEVFKGLRVYTGLSFIDGKIKRSDGATLDGKTAIGVPDHNVTASVDWDVPGIPGLALLGSVVRTDATWIDSINTQRIPPSTRFDAGLRYRTRLAGKETVFRLNVENLVDRNYFTNEGGAALLAAPRTFLISATVDF